jgi:phosphotransferase system IIA component
MNLASKVVYEPDPSKLSGIALFSPASGSIQSIDEEYGVLSNFGVLGDGVVFKLESHNVIAPFTGKVIATTPYLGKIILQANNKLMFLFQVHEGSDAKHSEGIKLNVKVGDKVKKGQSIMSLDLYKLRILHNEAKLHVVIVNSAPLAKIQIPFKQVRQGVDQFMVLTPKDKK